MNSIKINALPRTLTGKSGSRQVKRDGLIPAVIYGNTEPELIKISLAEVRSLVYTSDFNLAQINIDGKEQRCILKDIQFDPITEAIRHMDFLRLKDGHKVKVEVPVRFKGTSPGVKVGGKLIQQMRKLKIKTTPENLVDEVKVDISHLELGGVLRVKEVKLNDKIEILANPATPLANIEIPRALKSAAAAEAKAAAGGKKKK